MLTKLKINAFVVFVFFFNITDSGLKYCQRPEPVRPSQCKEGYHWLGFSEPVRDWEGAKRGLFCLLGKMCFARRSLEV